NFSCPFLRALPSVPVSPSIFRFVPRVFSPSSSQFCAPARAIPTAMVSSARSSGGMAHSASNSAGSAGSPSGGIGPGNGVAAAAATTSASASTPASGSTVARRLNDLEIQGDDAPSSQPAASKKKKKGTRVVGPDKGNRGLRQFSMKVCEKVEGKGRTTYNEVFVFCFFLCSNLSCFSIIDVWIYIIYKCTSTLLKR
uniref:Uncharacterized protein n=1 Tax=Aegilops tauschii subsp. strangulata TaxID=200361 RepID=A0A452YAZ5_AEGTS